MIPSPPTWISSSITTWPNGDQYVPVSTTARPVTQTHEVAVKSAVRNGALLSPALANGSTSSAVPIAITVANEYAMSRSGCCAPRRRLRASSGRRGAAMSTARECSRAPGRGSRYFGSSSESTARKASCGTSTMPSCFIRFLPFFCFSISLRLREMSPP